MHDAIFDGINGHNLSAPRGSNPSPASTATRLLNNGDPQYSLMQFEAIGIRYYFVPRRTCSF